MIVMIEDRIVRDYYYLDRVLRIQIFLQYLYTGIYYYDCDCNFNQSKYNEPVVVF